MVEAREVVIETMDGSRGGLDFPRVEARRGLAVNGQCETECKETGAGHEGEDGAGEAGFLSPSPLLLGCSDAASSA